MLRGFSKWFAYIILTAIAILVILSLTGQMGVVRELKEHIAIAKKAGIPNISILEVIRLHRRFTGLLIISFFGFLLICAGLLTVMQHSRDAYLFSEVQDKVRYSLKRTSPGVLMLMIGALALAISNYGYSYLERRYSNIFSAIQRDRMAHLPRRSCADTSFVRIDTALLRSIFTPVDSVAIAQAMSARSDDSLKNIVLDKHSESSKPVVQKPVVVQKETPVARQKQEVAKKGAIAKKETVVVAKKFDKKVVSVKPAAKPVVTIVPAQQSSKDSVPQSVIAKRQDTAPPPVATTVTNYPDPVHWAKSLQRRVVMFGYVPTKQDRQDYAEIIRVNSGDPSFNGDMRWAYGFVTRILDGYQPTAEELRHYESVVSHSLAAR